MKHLLRAVLNSWFSRRRRAARGSLRALTTLGLGLCLASAACRNGASSGAVPPSKEPHRVVHCFAPERGAVGLRRDEDLVVLVHGCNSSIAKFENLAKEFESRGQQVACFGYDDRDSLISSARELNVALDELRGRLGAGQVTLIGHSQGGLIARRAAAAVDQSPVRVTQLVTIAAPFSGIRSARNCGSLPIHILTFGISAGVCQMIAGRKWTEIHRRAPFMVDPPALAPEVQRHLAVLTDETAACLARGKRGCDQDNIVFTLKEQGLGYLDDTRIERQVVRAEHAAIVGEEGRVSVALIALLEAEDILRAPAHETAVAALPLHE